MKKILTKSFLLAAILMIALEIFVRVFFAQNMAGRFEYGYHPTAGFVEKGDRIHLVRSGGRRFRPQTFQKKRDKDLFRIFVIGDSVVRGPNLDSAYPALLAKKIQAEGIHTEALNMGIGGFGVRRCRLVLQQALKYDPSLIVLHMNDSNEYEDEREYKRSQEFKSWHPKNWLMKSLVVRRLYELKTEKLMWELLPKQVRIMNTTSDADAEIQAGLNPDKIQEWNQRIEAVGKESIQDIQHAGVPFIVISQCRKTKNSNDEWKLKDRGLDQLIQNILPPQTPFLSMKKIFEHTDYTKHFSDSAHLRDSGHEILAQAIFEKLRKDNLIPQPDPQVPTAGD